MYPQEENSPKCWTNYWEWKLEQIAVTLWISSQQDHQLYKSICLHAFLHSVIHIKIKFLTASQNGWRWRQDQVAVTLVMSSKQVQARTSNAYIHLPPFGPKQHVFIFLPSSLHWSLRFRCEESFCNYLRIFVFLWWFLNFLQILRGDK